MFSTRRWTHSDHDVRADEASPAIERLDMADLHFATEMADGVGVELPGRGTAFVRTAAGPAGAPTILLVHGLFATADLNWSTAIPVLARHFRVVAPDLRGHGRGLATRHFSASECADDLAALVEVLGVGPVIVVGYSLGGVVAQEFIRRHSRLVAGLVLCATACSFQTPAERPLLKLLQEAGLRAPEWLRRSLLLSLLRPRSASVPAGRWLMDQVRRHDTRALLEASVEAAAFDSRRWLVANLRPAAVIVTTEDRVVPAETQRDLARALGGAPTLDVAGDHFACVKRPDEFNRVLVDACVSVVSGGSS